MLDRRQGARDKVIYGGVADIDQRGTSRNCIVRNISDNGASVEFSNVVNLPREQISLRIARKGRSFLARVVWWRDNFVGLAFNAEAPTEPVEHSSCSTSAGLVFGTTLTPASLRAARTQDAVDEIRLLPPGIRASRIDRSSKRIPTTP